MTEVEPTPCRRRGWQLVAEHRFEALILAQLLEIVETFPAESGQQD